MTLISSLVEYWQLDEASGNRAGAHAGLTLTDNNTVGSNTGLVYSNAASFVASSSEYLSRASESTLQTGDIDFWFAAWAYPTALNPLTFPSVIGKDVQATNREYLILYDSGTNRWRWVVGSGGGGFIGRQDANTFGAPSINTWHLLVVYHSATSNQVGISVNGGAFDTSATTGAPSVWTNEFRIGGRTDSAAGTFFDGRIGPVLFGKNYVPDSADVTWLYNGGAGRTYADFSGGGGDFVGARFLMPSAQIYQPRGL